MGNLDLRIGSSFVLPTQNNSMQLIWKKKKSRYVSLNKEKRRFLIELKAITIVAAIAPWFHQRLPSCGPWFESQAHHICFFNLYYCNCNEKRIKINKKRPGLAHLKKQYQNQECSSKDNNTHGSNKKTFYWVLCS